MCIPLMQQELQSPAHSRCMFGRRSQSYDWQTAGIIAASINDVDVIFL